MMEFHDIANLFPMLPESELAALSQDIAVNGLVDPICLHEGKILDGRNRYKACQQANVPLKTYEFEGDDPIAYVISLNLHRRHLTASQRAAVAVDMLPLLEKQARERQATSTGGKQPQLKAKMPEAEKGQARTKAAKQLQVGDRYVSEAKRIKATRPEDYSAIRNGDKTISEVLKQERKEQKAKQKAAARINAPEGTYRVIYADPPWSYGDKRGDGTNNEYTGAEHHYPSMSIDELCELPVRAIAQDDAVLFMWVTSPLLYEAAPLIEAWGFQYKACFVWDKVGHNVGHYNSVRHEFLLICTRGSCTPDVKKLHDSVVSIEKTRKHSEKPEEFRALIDAMYPEGERIELFRRGDAPEGWNIWGNEADGT